MTAGVDAAADVKVDVAQVVQLVQVLVALGDGGRQRHRAGIGQGAVVAAGAGDHVGEQTDVRLGQAERFGFEPKSVQLVQAHPGQHQVLGVRHAGFASGILGDQCGGSVQLVGGGVTGGLAHALERQAHGAQCGVLVRFDVLRDPAGKGGRFGRFDADIGFGLGRPFGGVGWQVERRRGKAGGHAVELGLRDGVQAAVFDQNVLVFGLDFVKVTLAFGLDQNLDACLVQVVPAAPSVVDADHGFEVIHDLVPRQELADLRAHHRGSAHAAAHQHLEAHVTRRVFDHLQAHVVPANGGAVFCGAGDGDLELARQESEFGVQRAPLADQLGVGPGIDDFVDGHTSQLVGGGVADAVAAGLDAVQVHAGQEVHHVGRFGQGNPVELHVLAGGEVTVVGGQLGGQARNFVLCGLRLGQQGGVRRVVVAGDLGQHLELGCRDFAIRHGHAQHGRVALHVPAVLQAQGLELIARELPSLKALELVTVLGSASAHELFVKFGVLVHGSSDRKNRFQNEGALRSFPS